MKQTYCVPTLKIISLNSDDIVTASGIVIAGEDYLTNGQYDGSNVWNGF